MLLFSRCHVWLFATQWTAARQASLSFTVSWNLLRLMSIDLVMPSNHLILCSSLLLLPLIFTNLPMSQLFPSGSQSIGASASASASVLPVNIQTWFPLGLTGSSLCCPRDSQESSAVPQFENINSSALSLLYGPALTSVHDYWKDHILGYTDLCQQSDVFAF